MKTIRRSVFETNSSSTHSIVLQGSTSTPYYKLSSSGYLMIEFYQIWSETDYTQYKILNDKLSFLLTLFCAMHSEKSLTEHYKKYRTYNDYNWENKEISYSEFKKDKTIRAIFNLVTKRIPNCKGVRLKKGSFNTKGYSTAECDGHHINNTYDLGSYLENHGTTLEDYLFNPNIAVQMNP